MLLLFLITYIHTIAATVTLYQWPYYKGQSITFNQSETSIQQIQGLTSIQSIQISANESLITYDQDNFRGNNATWYRSVVYPGNWKDRIRSFRIVPAISLPIDTQKQNAIEAPWYFMGTWEGFMLVRMSTQWPGYPECYSVNGVNCILRENIYDMFDVVEEYKNNATLNDSSTAFNAPCGPPRYEHWGNDPKWCKQASSLLKDLVNGNHNLKDLKCVRKNNGVIARTLPNYCLPRTHTTDRNVCTVFPSMDVCEATLKSYLFSSKDISNTLHSCGYDDDCMEPYSQPVNYDLLIPISLVGFPLAFCFAVWCCKRRKNQEQNTTERGVRNTCRSNEDMDENATSPQPNNVSVRAP
ncbi:hypothetical protein THRCLA_22344 [Thraustotheca clavata]|uniref:Beta/gamma crystallin 'Greek key' domain-containing protein n=1 Tax=Thraustotheca clavata TaxID=74557 RepID=A0A1V9Z577_9STRA|nr:hypothetical protein THRCLA_22344 [Thraustotheca clavata]